MHAGHETQHCGLTASEKVVHEKQIWPSIVKSLVSLDDAQVEATMDFSICNIRVSFS